MSFTFAIELSCYVILQEKRGGKNLQKFPKTRIPLLIAAQG